MANNANAQAIAFSNTKVRPAADALTTAYLTLQTLVAEWNAQNIAAVIPNDSNFIQDGATVASGTPDGRPPITDGQINIFISNANSFLSFMQANTNLILNQTMQVMVNGRSAI
jgi:hypothetical protein